MNNQVVTFPAVSVDLKVSVRDALFKAFSRTPFYIFTDRAAFFLGEGCQKSEHQFTILGQRVNMFFLKSDGNPKPFEVANCLQKVDRVSGEA